MAGKKSTKSLFRRVNEWLHLWLGLLSGVVVFVVCFTAAIWVFRDEIAYFTQPFNRVPVQDVPYKAPAALQRAADGYFQEHAPENTIRFTNIRYREDGKTALIVYRDAANRYGQLHLNPYTGSVVYDENIENSNTQKFLIFIRAGHRFFWLPQKIGSPVVGVSCIIFLITLITGLIWWYPKKWTRSTREKSFNIKWKAKWKRLNIDLHNVLGFYALLITFILTYTGIYYTFNWFREGHHYLMTGKAQFAMYPQAAPDTTRMVARIADVDARLWEIINREINLRQSDVFISYPTDGIQPYRVNYNPNAGTLHKAYSRYYDQRDLAELTTDQPDEKFEDSSLGLQIVKLNFDLHVGTIGGLTTKIIAAIASLIGASLPVTGFIIWYNRKWGRKKRRVGAK